ncbi:hypothetical protein M758_1G319100 [Ceratodon purpureus]|uniref:Leucine-rich repeat-containing N-terminal plant-type domain-containing protein n=1 Tax=Ceratodon purpureus TaxID=3225 RepID=A0A8T0JFE7_CERPU|nr:hypothetical protein KC19_1G326300 [Ceratodon purpureus]KAG0632309.1 hypothetical protein M758_1G319100 [Ceratodon purpureus]
MAGGSNASLISLVVLVLAVSGCQAWDCSATDRAILLDFKNSFVDNTGVFSSWNSTSSNCCTWQGVTCRESDGAVLELAIVGSSASNQQPYRDTSYSTVGSGLVGLTHLQKLKIQWVLFNGGIPSTWGAFSSNLIWITINNANLRNDIPSNLANIQSLERLDLKSNHLTGSIPSTFCSHPNLNYIDVSYNDMNYILVPACLQGQNNITIIYGNQGQSTSPGSPGAGSILTVASSVVLAFGAISTALLFL